MGPRHLAETGKNEVPGFPVLPISQSKREKLSAPPSPAAPVCAGDALASMSPTLLRLTLLKPTGSPPSGVVLRRSPLVSHDAAPQVAWRRQPWSRVAPAQPALLAPLEAGPSLVGDPGTERLRSPLCCVFPTCGGVGGE